MPLYLTRFSYTPATWAKLMKNPEDRRQADAPSLTAREAAHLRLPWHIGQQAPDDVANPGFREYWRDSIAARWLQKR